MTSYLLDVNALVALLVKDHDFFAAANEWAAGKKLAVCPLSELGFFRVVINAYGSTMEQGRDALQKFYESDAPSFLPADVSALETTFKTASQSTDAYLAHLAGRHGMKLATFDGKIKHATAEIIPSKNRPASDAPDILGSGRNRPKHR